jgi:tetratricopeptide (TPR) repeat protein
LLAKILVRLKQCEHAAEVLQPTSNPPALDTQSLFLLGNAYERAGQTELAASARDEFAAASQADRKRSEDETQSKHLVEQANDLARQNRFPDALELLNQALEKNPSNGFAYSQQAKIHFSMHRPEEARQAIQRALAIQPFQPDFLYVSGVIAAQQGKQDEALAAFEKVTQIDPKEADAFLRLENSVTEGRSGRRPRGVPESVRTGSIRRRVQTGFRWSFLSRRIQEKELERAQKNRTQSAMRRERRQNWSSSDYAKDGLFRCARREWGA